MDLYCPTCSEPWDHDSLHEEADARKEHAPAPNTVGAVLSTGTSYQAVAGDFRKRGCKALETAFGPQRQCAPADAGTSETIAAIYDLMGDDMDAAAVFLEDAQGMGLL